MRNRIYEIYFARKLLQERARDCGLALEPSSRWGRPWALYDASNNVSYYSTLLEVNEELLKRQKQNRSIP